MNVEHTGGIEKISLIPTVKVIEYDNMEYTNRGMVMVMNATSDFVHDSSHTSFDKLSLSFEGNE